MWDAVRKRLVLDRAGSASCFRAAVSSEEVPHGKPVGRRGRDVGCGLVNPATRHCPSSSNGGPVLTDLRQLSSAIIGRLGANGDR